MEEKNMFTVDKVRFGEFLVNQRKEKGYTQKELADMLFVSDKAVSKWERGLSLPDISLLIPMSEILDITVTELLEGKKVDNITSLDTGHVEKLVIKALTFSEDSPEKKKARKRRNILLFGGCVLISLLEILAVYGMPFGIKDIMGNVLLAEFLSFLAGIYFWFFIKERLPGYYDENKISAYSDGVFRMNMPGISFNNSNWRYIVKVGRIWTARDHGINSPYQFAACSICWGFAMGDGNTVYSFGSISGEFIYSLVLCWEKVWVEKQIV